MHVIFIHGTGGTPDEAFFPWCRKKLEKLGYKTSAPELPSSMRPNRKRWIDAVMEAYASSEETVLVGRSLGGTLIPFLLERNNVHARMVISIAAPINDLAWSNLKGFFSAEADFKSAKDSVDYYHHWYSNDDPYVPLAHGQTYQKLLGGDLRIFTGYSHFYCEEFPEIVQLIENDIDSSKQH